MRMPKPLCIAWNLLSSTHLASKFSFCFYQTALLLDYPLHVPPIHRQLQCCTSAVVSLHLKWHWNPATYLYVGLKDSSSLPDRSVKPWCCTLVCAGDISSNAKHIPSLITMQDARDFARTTLMRLWQFGFNWPLKLLWRYDSKVARCVYCAARNVTGGKSAGACKAVRKDRWWVL